MKKYIASVSWGKDSTAMLLFIIKNKMPLDEVVFYNTGVEFEAIYKVRDEFIKYYLKPLNIKYCKDAIQYIGIAYDEPKRFERLTPNKKAPLFEAKITEDEALKICYNNGFYFGGLYKILKRVSCWCCRNKNLQELKSYKEYLPQYYERLKELENLIGEPMKKPYYLHERFDNKERN